eukprot:m.59126 g.59126  ORF g.59126 m.59126 type:complete len:312 (+) comp11750_c0_seq3:115-1050(+)
MRTSHLFPEILQPKFHIQQATIQRLCFAGSRTCCSNGGSFAPFVPVPTTIFLDSPLFFGKVCAVSMSCPTVQACGSTVEGLPPATSVPAMVSRAVHRVARGGLDKSAAAHAAQILQQNGVICVPTDTLYGIACRAQSASAVERLYSIKGRVAHKPVAICVPRVEDIEQYANVTVPKQLLHELLPGPVTVVLPRTPVLNASLNPGVERIGIRVLDTPVVQSIMSEFREPIALTSANFSGQPSCIKVEECEALWPLLDAVYDAGPITSQGEDRSGSSVIDLSCPGHYSVIRKGSSFDSTVETLHKYHLQPQPQ